MLSSILGALLCVCVANTNAYSWDEPTALDDYVNYDDGAFSWTILDTYRFDSHGVTVYVINMTSQYWMDESFSNAHIWWHYQVIAVPDVLRRNFAFEFIEGQDTNPPSNPPAAGSSSVALVRDLSATTGYVTSVLLQVPNQHIIFANDPDQKPRREDDFISWTWLTYITTHQSQPQVIARMPMTKAGKRGLDAIRELVLSVRQDTEINEFGVGGGSKRGWTAWSVAATDRRVVVVTPLVMSLMDFNRTLQAHYRNMGGWTFTFYDYYEKGLTSRFHDDIVTNWDYGLWTYEDMFRYKERLELIPKLMISASGDEFFLPTDSHTWWENMGGPKWIMMNPNSGHGLGPVTNDVIQTVAAWLLLILEPITPNVPNLVWLRGEHGPNGEAGRISLNVDSAPDDIKAWVAYSPLGVRRKDFRLHAGFPPQPQNVEWTTRPVIEVGPGVYDIIVDEVENRYAGFYIETVWTRLVPGLTLRLTTEIHVSPETYPYDECYGQACTGVLV